jgi:hypothetical protein
MFAVIPDVCDSGNRLRIKALYIKMRRQGPCCMDMDRQVGRVGMEPPGFRWAMRLLCSLPAKWAGIGGCTP